MLLLQLRPLSNDSSSSISSNLRDSVCCCRRDETCASRTFRSAVTAATKRRRLRDCILEDDVWERTVWVIETIEAFDHRISVGVYMKIYKSWKTS